MAKSKFITFILSVLPGLGHFYLGLMNRGLAMMGVFVGLAGTVGILIAATRSELPLIFLAVLPVIWVYSLFDALNSCQRLQLGEKLEDRSPLEDLSEALAAGQRSRLWALIFSCIPGAGHMYLGWQQRGLQFMLAFFASLFLMDWLHLSLFLFLLPVIWFYSLFDAMQLASGSEQEVPQNEKGLLFWLVDKQRWVGMILITLGMLIIFDQLIVPYLNYTLIRLIKTGIVAALFIGGGLRLALGNRISLPEEEGKEG